MKRGLFIGLIVAVVLLGVSLVYQKEGSSLGGTEFYGAGTSTQYSIGLSTTTTVLSSDTGLTYAVLTNYGPGFITITTKQTATSTNGLRLLDVGDYHEMYGDNLIITNLYAIASSSTSTLGVYFHR